MSGADLRDARSEREWTQAELADRLGVTQAYVCLLERNRRAVPRRLAQKLASVLKLSPSMLPMSAGRASRRNRHGEKAGGTRANLGRIAAAARGRVPRVVDRR